jgi:bifunctional DNA-binding transcriptional regulator/antitoxin component of YhaV-PrlF toxin-antitoxin module
VICPSWPTNAFHPQACFFATKAAESRTSDNEVKSIIRVMRGTITAPGQTVVPAPIREHFGLGPSSRMEWVGDGDGSIRVVPVDLDPIRAFRGSGSCGNSAWLLGERQRDRQTEGE